MRRLIIVLVATALAAAGTTVATIAETHSARWSGAGLRAGGLMAPANHAPGWHEATLVGGIDRLAAVIGLPGAVDRVQLWRDVARRVHASEVDRDNLASFDDLRVYAEATDELQRALGNDWSADGLTLAATIDRLGSSRTRDVLRALGLRLEEGRSVRPSRPSDRESAARRRVWTKAGLPIEILEQQLADGHAISIPLPVEKVPTPLSWDVWQSIRGGDPAAPISAASLFTDRRASLLGDGLLTLDAETLAALAADRDTLTELYRRRSGPVAAFGRSLRIRNGRVQVPGGEAAEPIWIAIVGAPATDVAGFVRRLFEQDEGRVAFFYDALAHLDAPHLAFALGGPAGDVDARVRRARALYASFASDDANLEALPFSRPSVSPAVMLLEIAVSGDGQPAFPASRVFWDAAYAEGPVLAGSAIAPASLMAGDPVDRIDAGWLMSRLASELPAIRRERFLQVLFAQRLFGSIDPAQLTHALVAVRGVAAMPALVLTLERLGITEPLLFAEAVRAADTLAHIAHRGRASIAMAQFQGVLALIERLCWSRSLGAADAATLLRALFTMHPTDERFDGAIARWLDQELVPRLRRTVAVDAADGPERVLMAAIAGMTPETDNGDEQLVVWEGLTYRVDLGARELDRLTGVRDRQDGNSLDAVLAFTRAAAALAHGPSSLATLDSLQAAIQTIGQARAGLRSVSIVVPGLPAPPAESTIAKALKELQDIRQASDLPNAALAAVPLVTFGDALLARALTAIVYATSVGAADGMVLLAGDVSERHDFGLGAENAAVRRRRPWALPTERIDVGRPWHVRGSLLALDVGLGRLRLRRIADAVRQPTLTVSERHAFTDAAILFNPRAVVDADRSAIVAAMARGRGRVQALTAGDELDPIAAESGMSEWRREALAWTLQHEPNRTLSLFSLGELLRLGRPERDLARRLDRWGTAATATTGCLCVQFPPPVPPESYAGRKNDGLVAAMVPDILLRALELLDRLDLPASLAAGVLESVTQEYVDEVGTAYDGDWLRMVRHAQALTEERMADHVSALTAVGALVPVESRSGFGLQASAFASPSSPSFGGPP